MVLSYGALHSCANMRGPRCRVLQYVHGSLMVGCESDINLNPSRWVIRPFCIMLLYGYLLHYRLLLHIMSQYLCLFSLILQGLHEEGEYRQLEFWAGKGANIRDLFCKAPKALKLHGGTFWNIYKILEKESTRGGPHSSHEGGGAPPCLVAPLEGLRCPSSVI